MQYGVCADAAAASADVLAALDTDGLAAAEASDGRDTEVAVAQPAIKTAATVISGPRAIV